MSGPPAPSDHPWFSVPSDLLHDIKSDGFYVHERADGVVAIFVSREHPHNLLRMRIRPGGKWEAFASGNSGFGKTDAFKAAASRARAGIETGLTRTSRTGKNVYVRESLKAARVHLVAAEKKFSKRTVPESEWFRRRVLQAGAPGLGKRA